MSHIIRLAQFEYFYQTSYDIYEIEKKLPAELQKDVEKIRNQPDLSTVRTILYQKKEIHTTQKKYTYTMCCNFYIIIIKILFQRKLSIEKIKSFLNFANFS